ncbi:MAG: thioredoxin family protein [Deltaproteobacteria bacterium]|nr:thioredoxin family protein [Deltaproteobacteria bacterium]
MRFLYKHGAKCLGLIIALMFFCQTPVDLGRNVAAAAAKPALYDFGMGKCAPCIKMEKVLAAIKSKYGDQIEVRLVMAETERELFQKFKIVAVPTQVFLDPSGQEVDRHLGFMDEDALIKKLKDLKFIN